MAKAKANSSATNGNENVERLAISPPKIEGRVFRIVGTAPYVQNKFSEKAMEQIRETQEAGSQSKKGKKREAKDFEACYEGAIHKSKDGWFGIPAPAFRNAMISACRMAGFKMTHAKLSVFVEADGFDEADGTPLVKITNGAPLPFDAPETILPVRNQSGVIDLRARPMWREGWEAMVRVRFDADQFSSADVANLLLRAGLQVGIGEGRPDSKQSNGMGWGTFSIAD